MTISKTPMPIHMLGIAFLLVYIIFFQLIVWDGKNSPFLILCTCCSLIFTLSIAIDKRGSLFSPLFWVFLIVFVGITVRGYYMVYLPSNDFVYYKLLGGRDIGYFTVPTFLVFLSLLAFVFGYHWARRPYTFSWLTFFKNDCTWNQRRLNLVVLLFLVISVIGIVLFVRAMGIQSILSDISSKRFLENDQGGFKVSLGYYRLMASFIEPAFYIFLMNFIIGRKKMWSRAGGVLIVLGLFSLFFPVFTSSRTGVMFILVNVLVILGITRRLSLFFLSFVTVSGLVMFSAVSILRSADDVAIAETNILDPVIFNRNLLDISVSSNIINEVPEKMPYQYGKTILPIIFTPIPRSIWPEKPIINLGYAISHEIYDFPDKTMSGIPPGIIGELYINFSIIGVLLGMLLLGIFMKRIFLYFNFEREFNRNKVILYTAVLVNGTVLLFGGSFNQSMLGFLQAYVPLYFGLRYISARPRFGGRQLWRKVSVKG